MYPRCRLEHSSSRFCVFFIFLTQNFSHLNYSAVTTKHWNICDLHCLFGHNNDSSATFLHLNPSAACTAFFLWQSTWSPPQHGLQLLRPTITLRQRCNFIIFGRILVFEDFLCNSLYKELYISAILWFFCWVSTDYKLESYWFCAFDGWEVVNIMFCKLVVSF